jgi:tRNA dimethylallyltransferase
MMNIKRGTLIVIAGPTGSGKSALAVRLAQHFCAPIISTDSRQFYRGLAIGTAQPTAEELAAAKHYFIADRNVEDDFNSGKYESEALLLLDELFKENRFVIAVGGSGLYIQALCDGMDNLPEADQEVRQNLKERLQNEDLASLVEELRQRDPEYYDRVDKNNPSRVMRALEVCIVTGRPYSEQRSGEKATRNFNIVKIATDMPRDILYDRINRRVDMMMTEGLEAEARAMLPHRECNALQTVGYSEMFEYFDGKISFEEAIELIKRNSRRYAKRQTTWFKRDEQIGWFHPSQESEIIEYIDSQFG